MQNFENSISGSLGSVGASQSGGGETMRIKAVIRTASSQIIENVNRLGGGSNPPCRIVV